MTAGRRRPRPAVYSHDGLLRPAAPGEAATDGRRWTAGFIAHPDRDSGGILVDHRVAEAICAQHQQTRAAHIGQFVEQGDAYEDALAEADAVHARIHLDGVHLVYDLRHVVGDSDAITSIEPDPDGRYRLGLGRTWYRIQAGHCDRVHDGADVDPPILVTVTPGDIDALVVAVEGQDVTWRSENPARLVVVRPRSWVQPPVDPA